MKKYETPAIEIEKIEIADVITASPVDCDPDCDNEGGLV